MKTHTASSGPVCDGKGHAKMRPSEVNGGLKHPYPAGNGDVSLGKESGWDLSCLQWETRKHSAEVTDSWMSQ